MQELERKRLKNKKKKLSKKKAKVAGDSGIESQSDKDEKKKEKPAEPHNEVRRHDLLYNSPFFLFSFPYTLCPKIGELYREPEVVAKIYGFDLMSPYRDL